MRGLNAIAMAALLAATCLGSGTAQAEWESITGVDPEPRPAAVTPAPAPPPAASQPSAPPHDTDTALAAAARRMEGALGVVTCSARGRPQPFGTAWSYAPGRFATNAHIVAAVIRCLKLDGAVFIAINKRPDLRFRVTGADFHSKYGHTARNFEGKESLPLSYDVGILETQESAPTHMRLAEESELRRIGSGYRVAYLGYPMEGLLDGNINIFDPVATMQSGIITSVSDYWQSDTGFENNVLLKHNLGATGGASGSPMFNANGEVVGILNGGNMVMNVQLSTDKQLDIARVPNAAMVNFGQRIDLLREIKF